MTRRILLYSGLVLALLALGQLAIFAAGSGKVVLEKVAKSAHAKQVVAHKAMTSGTMAAATTLRKDKEMKARARGGDPYKIGHMTNAELDAWLANKPQSSLPTLSPEKAQALAADAAKEAAIVKLKAELNANEVSARAETAGKVSTKVTPESQPAFAYPTVTPAEQAATQAMNNVVHRETHDQNSGHLDNSGGPDGGFYRYADNVSPDTAVYNWIELQGDGGATWLAGSSFSSMDDAVSALQPIGFSFPFYGTSYTQFWVQTNGSIGFSTTSSAYTNACLPTSSMSAQTIMPFWDDLYLTYGGVASGTVIGYKNFGTYMVLEYDSVGLQGAGSAGGSSLKFEVILFSDGKIKMQYNNLVPGTSTLAGCTVGIQSLTTGPSLQYLCNGVGPALANGRAIWFYQFFATHDFACTQVTSPLSVYPPTGPTVNVTGVVRNWGATTEAALLKYQFNGGTVQSMATNSLATLGRDSLTFSTQITIPTALGSYPMMVWTSIPGDADHTNDTVKFNVQVKLGTNCAGAIVLTGASGSGQYSFCGMGNNDVTGVPAMCSAGSWFNDMVFKMDVPAGSTGTMWIANQQVGTYNSYIRKTIRTQKTTGAACPGDSVIYCWSSGGDTAKVGWKNTYADTRTMFFVVGQTAATPACSTFTVAYKLNDCSTIINPDPIWSENFDWNTVVSGYYSTFPDCWKIENTDAILPFWKDSTSLPRSTANCAYIAGNALGDNDWLFTPAFSLTAQPYTLEFWRRGASATPESLQVMYGTSQTSAAMTNTIIALDTPKTATYAKDSLIFTPTAGTYYIGFHGISKRAASVLRIDDIQLHPRDACSSPTSCVVNSLVAADSVTLTCTASGGLGVMSYQWYSGLCGTGTLIPGATSSTYKTYASGIFSCNAYHCNPVTYALCDSAIATVIDCITPQALPFTQDFESTASGALPTCWSQQDLNADARVWNVSTSYYRTGTHGVYVQYTSSVAENDWLYTKAVQLYAGHTYYVDYWFRCALQSSSYTEGLEVFAGTAANSGAMTISVDPAFTWNGINPWTEHVPTFTVPTSGRYIIGFHDNVGINQGGVVLDDIIIDEQGHCGTPTVTVPATAAIGAVTLTATASGGWGGGLQYQWYTGLNCQVGNIIPGETNSTYGTTVSGIFSCKAYRCDASLYSSCDSAMATILPDPCLPAAEPTLASPFLENFDAVATPGLPTCWTAVDLNTGETGYGWFTNSTYPHSAANELRGEFITGVANAWAFTPPQHLIGGTHYVLSYWFRTYYATSYPESLEVMMGSHNSPAFMTTTLLPGTTYLNGTYTLAALDMAPATTGDYYVGFHLVTGCSSCTYDGMLIDDVSIAPAGCQEVPSVAVAAVASADTFNLHAVVTGGAGGGISYQWYTGLGCNSGNAIPGATLANYQTETPGIYSCRAYISNTPDTCGTCDSAFCRLINCADPTTAMTQQFDGATPPNLPVCWTRSGWDASVYWKTTNVGGESGWSAVSAPNTAWIYWIGTELRDWLYSPGVTMSSDSAYLLSFYYRQDYGTSGGTYSEDLSVWMGTAADSNAMTINVMPDVNFTTTEWDSVAFVVSPPSTGVYHFGWFCNSTNGWGIDLDNIQVINAGNLPCSPVTLDVPAVQDTGVVTLTATATGNNFGVHYIWYRGVNCNPANVIVGQTGATLRTDTSGTFSCKVWQKSPDSTQCNACDSAYALVIPPPPGEGCAQAIDIAPPASGSVTTVSGTTLGFRANINDTCATHISSGADVFYKMTLTACTRLAFALTGGGGDMHLSMYDAAGCATPIYCNDDDAEFTTLPVWDQPLQHPGGVNSYIAAQLNAGTYYFRVAYRGTDAGPYWLAIYNNGACVAAPCDPVTQVTAYISQADPTKVWLHFTAPSAGLYQIYSTTTKNAGSDPHNGLYTLDATDTVTAAGVQTWSDSRATVGFRAFLVVHYCPVLGRCCYGDWLNPTCIMDEQSTCLGLGGSWNQYRNCTDYPCVGGGSYCASTYSSTTADWITNVTFNTINHTTGSDAGYGNYLSVQTNVNRNTSYTLSVSVYSADDEFVYAWIDWNRDNVFDPSTEVYNIGLANNNTVSASILVPAGAAVGSTRMRVTEQWGDVPEPCNPHAIQFGETEDYRVNVQ